MMDDADRRGDRPPNAARTEPAEQGGDAPKPDISEPDGSVPRRSGPGSAGAGSVGQDAGAPGAGGDTDEAARRAADGEAQPESAAGGSDDEGADQPSGGRGLLGRLLDAIAPPDPARDEAPGAAPSSGAPRGLLKLRNMRVEDAAIPTVEIVSAPVDIALDDLVALFRDHGVSRIPVYRDTLDHPLGLIHLKDFALKHGFNGGGDALDLRALLRPLIYAPPSMPASVLLQKMQTERMHMALVIDEYGGVDGLVTLEDLIEQVVGEIEDEHDTDDDQFWTVEKPGVYLALSRTPLDMFEAEIGRRLTDPIEDEEIDTLGGLVFTAVGRVPARGEVIDHATGLQFEIVDADPRRIKRLRVRTAGAAAPAVAAGAAEPGHG